MSEEKDRVDGTADETKAETTGKPDRQDDGSAESYQCVSGLHAEEL